MAKREQKPRTTATGTWLGCNFSAHPEEIAAWKGIAQEDRRTLSFWIRDVLNKEVARLKGVSQQNHEKPNGETAALGLAEISGDRARSGD